jgi:hypothetical protein
VFSQYFVGLFVDIWFISAAEDITMGRVGFEHPRLAPSKNLISVGGDAKSDARFAPSPIRDSDLALVVEVWTNLLERNIRHALLGKC